MNEAFYKHVKYGHRRLPEYVRTPQEIFSTTVNNCKPGSYGERLTGASTEHENHKGNSIALITSTLSTTQLLFHRSQSAGKVISILQPQKLFASICELGFKLHIVTNCVQQFCNTTNCFCMIFPSQVISRADAAMYKIKYTSGASKD